MCRFAHAIAAILLGLPTGGHSSEPFSSGLLLNKTGPFSTLVSISGNGLSGVLYNKAQAPPLPPIRNETGPSTVAEIRIPERCITIHDYQIVIFFTLLVGVVLGALRLFHTLRNRAHSTTSLGNIEATLEELMNELRMARERIDALERDDKPPRRSWFT